MSAQPSFRHADTAQARDAAPVRVAIVTPMHHFPLTADEEISIRHLRHFLGEYDRYVIGPQKPPPVLKDFSFRPLPARYFRSVRDYNRLMVSSRFFETFSDYDFVLVYEADCLAFSSDLQSWCRADWDYVGAPWFKNYKQDTREGFWAVGNSGLSLRKVSAALEVLNSKQPIEDPEARAARTLKFKNSPVLRKVYVAIRTSLPLRLYRNNARWVLEHAMREIPFQNDKFWAHQARKINPNFRIPTPGEAVAFSFEMCPRYCFEQNNHRLPFGCHGWTKYDREFWDPYLLK